MEESILFAKKYLEDVLSFFGLNIDIYATSDEEVIELSVPSTHMNGFLIGQRGETIRALQYLVCTALTNAGHEYTRVNVDIADYKKNRHDRLAKQSIEWIEQVKSGKKPYELHPMNAADRRIVHKVAAEHGLTTESTGFGRDRHVVIKPQADDESSTEQVEESSGAKALKDKEAEKKPKKTTKKTDSKK